MNLNPAFKEAEFLNRKQELDQLQRLLHSDEPAVLLQGMGGIGKTALTQKYLHENPFRYTHVLWLNQKGDIFKSLLEQERLLFKLDLQTDASLPERKQALQVLRELGKIGGNHLLVIDNAELDMQQGDFLDFVPSNFKVLLISRLDLDFPKLELGPLSEADSVQLFNQHSQYGSTAEELKELFVLLGNNPLAIELLANTLHEQFKIESVEQVLELIKRGQLNSPLLQKQVELCHAGKQAVQLYQHLVDTFPIESIAEQDAKFLRYFAVLPNTPIRTMDFCKLLDLQEQESDVLGDSLLRLHEQGWLESSKVHVYHMNPLLYRLLKIQTRDKAVLATRLARSLADLLRNYKAPEAEKPKSDWDEALEKRKTPQSQLWRTELELNSSIKPQKESNHSWLAYATQVLPYLTECGNAVNYFHIHLASTYEQLELAQKSEAVFERYLKLKPTNFPQDITDRAEASYLATAFYKLEAYAESAKILEQSLQLDLQHFGSESEQAARSCTALAEAYIGLHRYLEAEKLLLSALSTHKTILGESHQLIAEVEYLLCCLYKTLGQYQMAIVHGLSALNDMETRSAQDNKNYVLSKYQLADLHLIMEQEKQAAEMLKSLSSAASYSEAFPFEMEHLYRFTHKPDQRKAQPDKRKARHEKQKEKKPSGPGAKEPESSLFGPGRLSLDVALAEKKHGPDHINCTRILALQAYQYSSKGELERAAATMKMALERNSRNLGMIHPIVARNQAALAWINRQLGRDNNVSNLLQSAININLSIFGDQHPEVALDRMHLASLYLHQDRCHEAEQLLRMAYPVLLKTFTAVHSHTMTCVRKFSEVEDCQKRT